MLGPDLLQMQCALVNLGRHSRRAVQRSESSGNARGVCKGLLHLSLLIVVCQFSLTVGEASLSAPAEISIRVEAEWGVQQDDHAVIICVNMLRTLYFECALYLQVMVAIYNGVPSAPQKRLRNLRTEDRIEYEYYAGDRVIIDELVLDEAGSYMIVPMARHSESDGEGEISIQIESTMAFDLSCLPPTQRDKPEAGDSCREALQKHAHVKHFRCTMGMDDCTPACREYCGSSTAHPKTGIPDSVICSRLYKTCPVAEVMAQLAQSGKRFTDDSFWPADEHLNQEPDDPNGKVVEADSWARCSECCDMPCVYLGGCDPDDCIQGQIGNCWFVSCLTALAVAPELSENLIFPPVFNPAGVYAVRVWWKGRWAWCLIDDWIPVDRDTQPRFIRSRGNELWMILLEKAYAKLHRLIGTNPNPNPIDSICVQLLPVHEGKLQICNPRPHGLWDGRGTAHAYRGGCAADRTRHRRPVGPSQGLQIVWEAEHVGAVQEDEKLLTRGLDRELWNQRGLQPWRVRAGACSRLFDYESRTGQRPLTG